MIWNWLVFWFFSSILSSFEFHTVNRELSSSWQFILIVIFHSSLYTWSLGDQNNIRVTSLTVISLKWKCALTFIWAWDVIIIFFKHPRKDLFNGIRCLKMGWNFAAKYTPDFCLISMGVWGCQTAFDDLIRNEIYSVMNENWKYTEKNV